MRSHGRIDGSFTGATASWPAASRSAFYGSAQSTSGISMATEAFRPSRAKRLILGTMRLHEIDRTVDQWIGFFATAFRLGVRNIHKIARASGRASVCQSMVNYGVAVSYKKTNKPIKTT